jgi:hypothetical protein
MFQSLTLPPNARSTLEFEMFDCRSRRGSAGRRSVPGEPRAVANDESTKIGESKVSPTAATILSNTRLMIDPNRSVPAVAPEKVEALNCGPTAAEK